MTVSQSSQWTIFGVFAFLGLVSIVLWFRFLPSYRAYKIKSSKLQGINSAYEELRKRRKDLVFHFYWSVDSGNVKEADQHESDVLDIDKKLETLRASYDTVERGGYFMSQGLPSLSLNPLLHFAEPSTFFEPFVIPLPSQTTPIDIPQEVLTRCREDFWYGNIGADNVFEYRSVEVPFEIAICLPNRNLTDNECRSIGITQSRGWVNFFRQNAERNILLFRRPRTDVSETDVTTRLVEELRSGLDWCSSLLSQQVQDGTSLLIFPMTAFDIPAPVWPGRGEELYITSGKQLIENQKEIFQFALYGSGFN